MKDRKQYFKEYREKNRQRLAAYNKEYEQRNKERMAPRRKDYREKNKDEIKARVKKWSDNNKEYHREHHREWVDKNRDKANARRREYSKSRKLVDIHFRVRGNLSTRLYHAVRNQGTTKDSTTMNLTGCDLDTLMSHLECQFTKGMTWENYGEWHIDHIKPCAKFDLTIDSEQKACFHYTNLQPLWAEDNLRKSDKYEAR